MFLQKPTGLSHISTIEIDEFSIKKYIEKQYQEDVGQDQLARDLLKTVSPLTCYRMFSLPRGFYIDVYLVC